MAADIGLRTAYIHQDKAADTIFKIGVDIGRVGFKRQFPTEVRVCVSGAGRGISSTRDISFISILLSPAGMPVPRRPGRRMRGFLSELVNAFSP